MPQPCKAEELRAGVQEELSAAWGGLSWLEDPDNCITGSLPRWYQRLPRKSIELVPCSFPSVPVAVTIVSVMSQEPSAEHPNPPVLRP